MKELMKENYKVENMFVRNLSIGSSIYLDNFCSRGKEIKYLIEDELTIEDKLAIIDSLKDGWGSYMLDMIDKYDKAKESGEIKKISYGAVHSGSVKAWIKRNDTRDALRQKYSTGTAYYFFGNSSYEMSKITPCTEYGYKRLYDKESIVHQWFHELLKDLRKQEDKYFEEHDEKTVNTKKLKQLIDTLSWIEKIDIDVDSLTLKEINMYIDKLESIIENVKVVINDIKINGRRIQDVLS